MMGDESHRKGVGEPSGWHLARTRPLCEYLAASALERGGYEIYFPCVLTPRPRSGHGDAPLFPGYLFVRSGQNGDGLPPIQHIVGLAGWVQFDDTLPLVSHGVISDLDRRLKKLNKEGGYWRRYQPGEEVRVMWGLVESLAEVLEEPKSPDSGVHVLLKFMGRLVPARVAWQDLRPIADVSISAPEERRPRRTRGRGRWVRGFGPRAIAGV